MEYKISASILNADFSRLYDDIREVEDDIDEIHCDVMDGHFVDNISFGAPVIASLRKRFSGMTFDTHLMITDPGKYYGDFIAAGSDILVFHQEAASHSYHTQEDTRCRHQSGIVSQSGNIAFSH